MGSDIANFRLTTANWPTLDTNRKPAIGNRQSLHPSATADGTDFMTLSPVISSWSTKSSLCNLCVLCVEYAARTHHKETVADAPRGSLQPIDRYLFAMLFDYDKRP